MSFDEKKLIVWMDKTDKRLARLEANQMAIINGDFCNANTEPKEPLIEDEKIREIIRSWAKTNDVKRLKYNVDENSLEDVFRNTISFNYTFGLEDGHSYHIDELCGEEEAPEPIEPTFVDLDERIKEKEEE